MKWFFVIWTFYTPHAAPVESVVEKHSKYACEESRARIVHIFEMNAEEDPNFSYTIGECSVRETN